MAKEVKLPRFLTPLEVTAMVKASTRYRDRMIIKTLFFLAIRNSELCSMDIKDIDFINKNVKVVQGKNKKDRYISINRAFIKDLKEWVKDRKEGKLFKISNRHLRIIIKNAAIKAGIRDAEVIHPHTLRHSYATYLQNSGVSLNTIQQILGHSRIETTTVYVHLGIDGISKEVNEKTKGLKI